VSVLRDVELASQPTLEFGHFGAVRSTEPSGAAMSHGVIVARPCPLGWPCSQRIEEAPRSRPEPTNAQARGTRGAAFSGTVARSARRATRPAGHTRRLAAFGFSATLGSHDLNWARTPDVSRGTRATAGETHRPTRETPALSRPVAAPEGARQCPNSSALPGMATPPRINAATDPPLSVAARSVLYREDFGGRRCHS
jgi:hypothetical protein